MHGNSLARGGVFPTTLELPGLTEWLKARNRGTGGIYFANRQHFKLVTYLRYSGGDALIMD